MEALDSHTGNAPLSTDANDLDTVNHLGYRSSENELEIQDWRP
jgi:hypothetical protein